ncbi:hypothetical protein [uncultured Chitinophaga sp.]|uniref:hypothetical protein n=1 Tax=uncultured Chitinophaga sp. TaxID=339340 RepID=UPI0025CDC003|nr:hypothetical protein [uncultured Chitinophaga sp.]
MQQFRISAEGISQLTRKGFYKSFSIVLFALAALFVMGPLNVDTGEIKVTPLLFAIPVLLGVMIYSIIRSNNRLRLVLNQYSIQLDQTSITRRQAQTPELHIPFADISGIYQKKDGIIIVAGRNASDLIVVMPELEGYGQLLTILQNIRPFAPLPKETLFQQYPIHTALTALAIMIVFYMTHNKLVALGTGIPLILLAGWAVYKLWSLRGTKSKLRRSTWAFMAILLVIIGSVALKLSAL